MFCEDCGNRVEQSEQFCTNCGAKVSNVNQEQADVITEPVLQTEEPKEPTRTNESFFSKYKMRNIGLEDAEKYIKNAWVAALVSAGMTGVIVLLGILDTSSWFDVGLELLFAYGIYRRNRIAAIGLFVYFILSKLIQIGAAGETEGFNIASVLVSLLFLHYFYLGMVGVIRHQQLVPKENRKHGVVFGVVVGSLATLFIVLLLIGLLPDSASPEDIILQADYHEGYKAGYVDGRAAEGELGDSYVGVATQERAGAYDVGYLAGFVDGCNEGGFDCTEVEQAVSEALGDTELPSDSGVQLIPNSI